MKALIVDDEALARRELRRLLEDHDWVEIVGEASNIEEALTLTHQLQSRSVVPGHSNAGRIGL